MAQFYAEIQGGRGKASRTGTKASGMSAHVRGWDVGARVVCRHLDEEDVIQVYVTSGSNGSGVDRHLATIRSDGRVKIYS